MSGFNKILTIAICVLFVGCREFTNPFAGDKVLARVGSRELLFVDVKSIFTPDLTPQDSVKLLENYVDMWVKKQIKSMAAEQIFSDSEDDIERMVEDYRNSLLGYKLDQYYVDRQLDTMFTNKEIEQYYDSHKEDFVLDRAIVKGRIIKLPESYRQKIKLRDLMNSRAAEQQQDVINICQKNGFELTEFNSWTDFSEFLSHVPTSKSRNNDKMLAQREVQEFADNENKYFAIISQSREAGEQMPIERVRDVIRRIIFNQRKMEIIRHYEDSIYNAVITGEDVEINLN